VPKTVPTPVAGPNAALVRSQELVSHSIPSSKCFLDIFHRIGIAIRSETAGRVFMPAHLETINNIGSFDLKTYRQHRLVRRWLATV